MYAILLLVLLVLSGCADERVCQAGFINDSRPDVFLLIRSESVRKDAECAAARWNRATGVRFGAGSVRTAQPVPIVTWDAQDSGFTASGDYDPVTQTATVSASLSDEWRFQVATHELGHALQSPELSHLPWGVRGIMRGDALSHDDDFIGTADLELICGGEKPLVPCVWMRAER